MATQIWEHRCLVHIHDPFLLLKCPLLLVTSQLWWLDHYHIHFGRSLNLPCSCVKLSFLLLQPNIHVPWSNHPISHMFSWNQHVCWLNIHFFAEPTFSFCNFHVFSAWNPRFDLCKTSILQVAQTMSSLVKHQFFSVAPHYSNTLNTRGVHSVDERSKNTNSHLLASIYPQLVGAALSKKNIVYVKIR